MSGALIGERTCLLVGPSMAGHTAPAGGAQPFDGHEPACGTEDPPYVAARGSVMDLLDRAGLPWPIYAASKTSPLGGYFWNICPIFSACLHTSQSRHVSPTSQLVQDAQAGKLPAWSMVIPTLDISRHNGHSMARGDNWISQAVAAIEHGPNWQSTAIFVTWDDCGCFYDHVTPPPGDGIRAPMLIARPYTRAGFTDSTQTTVAGGLLAFVEHTFGLTSLTNPDATAYDFRNAFNYAQKPLPALPMPALQRVASTDSVLADPNDPT
jgi:phospholipase C